MRYLSTVAVTAVLALSACSGDPRDPAAEPSDGPQATAPSEALADVPSVRPRTDARILLGPDGDLELLYSKVESDAVALSSLHAEDQTPTGTLTYVVGTDRCSGSGTRAEDGLPFDFVSTEDGRLLIRSAGQSGWVEARDSLADSCEHGPAGIVGSGALGFAAFSDPRRVGVEQVAGRRATHFRLSYDGVTVDSWIAADGAATRVLKVVESRNGAVVRTLLLSQFDSAGPVARVPS